METPQALPRDIRCISDWSQWVTFTPFCRGHASHSGLLYSPSLNDAIGLPNLRILISGYAPQHGANLLSASFKEYEAIGTLSRIRGLNGPVPVIASAGNSAIAALELGVRYNVPSIIVAPDYVDMVCAATEGNVSPLVILLRDAGYADVKRFASALVRKSPGRLIMDGGYRNVARREALALPFLHAVSQLGRVPQIYVQSVSSGCGPLGVLEASRSLVSNGLGSGLPKLLLVQNHPYAPIVDAYVNKKSRIRILHETERESLIRLIQAKVLSSADIPYGQPGGIREALEETEGIALAVTNREIASAQWILMKSLRLDVCEASGASLAGLVKALHAGRIKRDADVLLHLTGVGRGRLQSMHRLFSYARVLRSSVGGIGEVLAHINGYLDSTFATQGS
jgi:cysteate synthase